jgi:hypothetical protein
MLLVPPMVATGADAPGAVTVALVALAVAVVAVVLVVVARDVLASRSVVAGRASAYERPRIMAGRVTDPAHHPVRTRAPGHR